LLASFLGRRAAASGVAILNAAGIPTVPYPDTAARAFTYMVRYANNLKSLYETPLASAGVGRAERRAVAEPVFSAAGQEDRTLLTDEEATRLLEAYEVGSGDAAIATGDGERIPMRLSLRPDAQFGPVLGLGAGGSLRMFLPAEAMALPPLN
jgi:acetyltransferase